MKQQRLLVSAEVDTGRGKQVLVSTVKIIDRVPKYRGRFSGRVQIPYGGFHQLNANLLLTYQPSDADRAFGDRRFVGDGTASATALPIGCKATTSTIHAHSELVSHGVDTHDKSSTTGSYEITVGDAASMTFECGSPSTPITLTYPAYVSSCPAKLADAKTIGNHPAFGYALAVIDGSGTCTAPDGSKISAQWILEAEP